MFAWHCQPVSLIQSPHNKASVQKFDILATVRTSNKFLDAPSHPRELSVFPTYSELSVASQRRI